MQPNEYQDLAATTLVTTNDRDTLAMCGLGIAGEAGEICDLIKKASFHKGKPLNHDKLADEVGDLLWYIAIAARTLYVQMDELMPVINFGRGGDMVRIGLLMAKQAGEIAEIVYNIYNGVSSITEFVGYTQRLRGLVVDVAIMGALIGISLEDIMQRNIDKLAARHKSNGVATGFNSHYVSDSVGPLVEPAPDAFPLNYRSPYVPGKE